jgi:hypothetical protein
MNVRTDSMEIRTGQRVREEHMQGSENSMDDRE